MGSNRSQSGNGTGESGRFAVEVLLVGDSAGDARLIEALLANAAPGAYRLEWTASLSDAMKRCTESPPDVLLLDLSPPDSTALRTIEALTRWHRDLPVVVLTEGRDIEAAGNAVRAGAQDYLPKYDLRGSELVRSIRYAIERTTLERMTRESEAGHRELIAAAPYGVFRLDPDGRIHAANQAFADFVGAERPSELVGKSADYLNLDSIDREWAEASPWVGPIEIEVPTSSDAAAFGLLTVRRVRATDGSLQYTEGFIQDRTADLEAEKSLREVAKMEALGQFAAGVAHDLNNLFTVVLASVHALGNEMGVRSEAETRELGLIEDSIRQGAGLVQKILGFSRRERLDTQEVELCVVVREQARYLEHVLPTDIELVVPEAGCRAAVKIDKTSLQQMLMNLAANAAQAMPGGGAIEIVVEVVRIEEGRHPDVGEGDYACVSVSDEGLGMSERVKARAFDPFFSTKERGNGTGLGLSTVHGLVHQHGGFIELESQPGSGTRVMLFFPTVEEAVKPTPTTSPVVVSDSEPTVLVVDDVEGIRVAAARALRSIGYTVIEAEDGVEGLEAFRVASSEIDLIVTDVVMPRMSGRDMYDSIRTEFGAVPVLFVSGYAGADLAEHDLLDPELPLLKKPFSIVEFIETVRGMVQVPVEA